MNERRQLGDCERLAGGSRGLQRGCEAAMEGESQAGPFRGFGQQQSLTLHITQGMRPPKDDEDGPQIEAQ